jgi:phenylalanyl-tRNA synthetase beta chain
MRVPISWLREFVDLPEDSTQIADRLAMLGFPVEEIVRRPHITGVVIGRIVALDKHPNADRLQVGKIDIGGEAALTIATAATNVAQGQTIAVATIGAKLPHLTIERRKMRGLESEGMMISADELGLPAEWFEDGILQLEADAPLGTNAVDYFGLADDVLEVEITSNRVDAMSVIGLARELAASYGAALRLPSFHNPGKTDDPAGSAPRVSIETPDCNRFVAQQFGNIRVAPAPARMRVRLALAGQRPINNLVDISNYVMLETGQPLHFYDANAVRDRHFIVRDARAGEKLTTLDDKTYELTPQALVIADPDGPLGLAGLMGGAASEVREHTSAIVLEAANFEGSRVRRMSAHLGFRSEASSRHEKTLAPALADAGAARAAQLMTAIGATAYRPHAFGETPVAAATIPLSAAYVHRLLGLAIPGERIAAHLRALGCTVEGSGESFEVTPPNWRRDLAIAADLVEEVARMEGYDAIKAIEPSVPPHDISSAQYQLENAIADGLASLGYHEIVTHALVGRTLLERVERSGVPPPHHLVEVRNPLSEDQRYLRWAMGPGIMHYFARIDRPIRIFELGHIFTHDDEPISEAGVVCFGFTAEPLNEPAWRDSHFLRLKGDTEALIRMLTGISDLETAADERAGFHPGKVAAIMWKGREIAVVGKMDPRIARAFDVRFPAYLAHMYLEHIPEYRSPLYVPPSRYPSTYRDLALVVALDVSADAIERVARKAAGDLCASVRVFDEYRGPQVGEDHKSLAVRLTLQRTDTTITDEEADAAIARVLDALRDETGAIIRE